MSERTHITPSVLDKLISQVPRGGLASELAIDQLRAIGEPALQRLLMSPTIPEPALDRVAGQHQARTSGLFWHTDLPVALSRATALGRPVLSLRLLGRLDEELSCANSRFFRATLYRDPQVARVLRDGFVLHWASVCAVPKITVDFSDGRKIEGTITGNSVHLVLDQKGRPVDALPGLLDREAFMEQLSFARGLAAETAPMNQRAYKRTLENRHAARVTELASRFAERRLHANDRFSPDRPFEGIDDRTDWRRYTVVAGAGAGAMRAGFLAASKMRVERPLLESLKPPSEALLEDTARNTFDLHRRVHERLSSGPMNAKALTEWIYARLFLMPLDDPWLGLSPADAFNGIERQGRRFTPAA